MFARSVLARSVAVPSRLAHIRLPAVRMQHVIAMAAAEEGKKLYVGNLAWGASQNDLYALFGKYGEVSDAFIPTDRETGRPRGFAFVTLDAEGADAAVAELDGADFQGRALRVNEAQPQQPRTGGGGGGRGRGGYGRGGGGGGRGGYGRGGGSSYNYDSY